jgi:hypothetical protein
MYYTIIYADILIYTCIYQVKLINTAIDKAKAAVCMVCRMLLIPEMISWMSSFSACTEAELPELQEKAVAVLDLLQRNLPDKTGEKGKWKAHSILHKVREIILWGNQDSTSYQGPKVCICTY